MTSFLLQKKAKKTFQDRINKKAPSTQRTILTAIKSFENFCPEFYDGRTSKEIIEELNALKAEEQIDAIYEVIQNWIDWNYSHDVLTSTLRMYFSSLKQYLHHNGIKLNPQDIKDNLEFQKSVEEELYPLELDDIQKIFQFSNPKKLSFYTALISSGARPGELLQVRKKHIDASQKRFKIRILAENVKTRKGRSVFLTKEAMRYLSVRLRNLQDDDLVWAKNNNPTHALKAESKAFNKYCESAGFTERYKSNNFRKITLYSFRSYFFGKAADVHREGYAHKIIGHGSYLPQYDRISDEKKLEWFLKVEPELTIDQTERNKSEKAKLEKKKQLLKRVEDLEKDKKGSGELKSIVDEYLKEYFENIFDKIEFTKKIIAK